MKQIILTVALFGVGPGSLFADTITAKINGMVCAFCAQGIEKKFKAESSVDSVKVDLDAKTVTIDLKTGAAMSDDSVRKLIVGAGYEVESVDRASTQTVADTETD